MTFRGMAVKWQFRSNQLSKPRKHAQSRLIKHNKALRIVHIYHRVSLPFRKKLDT